VSFDYDTIRLKRQSHGTQWASYSDLFMVLAFIFLLMYMVASLRTGMVSITSHAEIEEVRQELELYEAVKTQYLAEQSNPKEKQIYQQVLEQITLLESEASENKQRLEQEYKDQKQRESALNQYQQMIVSMINANAVARAEANKQFTSEKQQNVQLTREIQQKSENVATLETLLELEAAEMAELKKAHSEQTKNLEGQFDKLKDQYAKGQGKLASLEDKLQTQESEKSSLESRHESESKALTEKFEKLREEHNKGQSKIASLEDILKMETAEKAELQSSHAEQTQELQQSLEELKKQQSEGQQKMASLEQRLATEENEKSELKSAYSEASQNLQSKIQDLTGKHDKNQAELAELEQKLKAESQEKLALQKTLNQETETLQGQIEELAGKHDESKGLLATLEQQLASETAEKATLESKLSEDTKKLQGIIEDLSGKQHESLSELASLQDKLAAEAEEKAALEDALAEQSKGLEDQLKALLGQHNQSQAEIAELEGKLQDEAAQKAALENASADEIEGLKDSYDQLQGELDDKKKKLAGLEDDIKGREGKIAELEKGNAEQVAGLGEKLAGLQDEFDKRSQEADKLAAELGAAQKALEGTTANLQEAQSRLADTSDELGKALELARARQDVARQIQDNFKDHGILAEVDSGSGDVILDFGKDYFDTDSAELKSGMKRTIRKAIPVYAQSLFATRSDVAKISAIEIVGFASPTYGGEPVNPVGLSAENRTAINYNLDLSYERARSIFDFAFDPEKIEFDHQDIMLPLIKVTGRSFFTEKIDPEDTGNLSKEEFCKQYNCYQSQRVIIKFGLSEKGAS